MSPIVQNRPRKTIYLMTPIGGTNVYGETCSEKLTIITAQDFHFEQSGPVLCISEAQTFQDTTNANEKPVMFKLFRALVHLAPGQFVIVEEEKE